MGALLSVSLTCKMLYSKYLGEIGKKFCLSACHKSVPGRQAGATLSVSFPLRHLGCGWV